MAQFGKMIGGGSEFRTALTNRLQNFQYGSDYAIFYEAFGNLRREHWIILSEKAANALQTIDWHGLKDFKSIEVSNADNPKVEATIDNELMKFIVETEGEEWINEYQTTNPTEIPEEIRRQKIEIILKQAKIEAEKSGNSPPSIDWSHLETKLKWTGTGDISYSKIKSLIGFDNSLRKLEKRLEDFERIEKGLENPDPNDPNVIYHRFETFEGDKKEVKEWGVRPSNSSQVGFDSLNLDIKKICPKCLDKGHYKVQSGDNFCRNCSEKLVEKPRIREITDQEAQEIQRQQSPFFPRKEGNY